MEVIEFVELHLEPALSLLKSSRSELRRFFLKIYRFFNRFLGFRPAKESNFEKVTHGIDRAHRVLLGTSPSLFGIGRIANDDGKYSNSDLRYPTLFYCINSFRSFTSSPDKYNLPVCIEQRHISVKQLTAAIEFLINMSKYTRVKSIRLLFQK